MSDQPKARASQKRKQPPSETQAAMRKNQRSKYHFQNAHKQGKITGNRSGIESGDQGIFVTCDRGREMKCIYELSDLLSEYCSNLDEALASVSPASDDEENALRKHIDLESSIEKEIRDMKPSSSTSERPFSYVRLDTDCVSFIKLAKHLDPVHVVHQLCTEAHANPEHKRTRFIKRLTPMTSMRKILPTGLEELCESVLESHFHAGALPKKFAIRPTIRDNNDLDRDGVIKLIASSIMKDEQHTVNLKSYDALVLVDLYRNVCGMSVVSADYDELKKYNLAELYQPSQEASYQATPAARPRVEAV